MKKQAPPVPLDESKLSSLNKRKAVDLQENGREKKRKLNAVNGGPKLAANSALKRSTNGKFSGGTNESPKSKPSNGDWNGMSNGKLKGYDKDHAAVNRQASTGLKRAKASVSINGLSKAGRLAVDSDEGVLSDAVDDFADFSASSDASIHSDDGVEDALDEAANGFLTDSSASVSVVDSDEDRAQSKNLFSDKESDSDASETLNAANIEGLSLKLDAQNQQEATVAQAELEASALQTNIAADIPSSDPNSQSLAPDLQLLRSRITETVRVLSSFSTLADKNRSRKSYLDQLTQDICTYYGYSPFLATKLLSLFPPAEAFAFFEANESPRPLTIRTNTLRTSRRQLAQALINRGVTLEPVGTWSKVGLQVFESAVPIGATPEYLSGKYMIQAASSLLPVMALAPQEHERILDMAAAPGGKTTHMAALMRNTGCIFANDANKSRAKALIGNIHRLGVKNTIVCSEDARHFPKIIGGFDRVLLDAPCSGTGVIAKDPSIKTNKTERDFLALPHLQNQILLAAIDSVDHASKSGGYIVYSTCSVAVEENEQVVQYALSRRPNVKIVETGLTFGEEGFKSYFGKRFDEKMKWARRYYPHRFNVDGFFVCKLKKIAPSPNAKDNDQKESNETGNENGIQQDDTEDDEGDLFAPIAGEDKQKRRKKKGAKAETEEINDEDDDDDDFGDFNDEEDKEIMERAQRNLDRKRGRDPKAKKPRTRKEGVND